MRPLPSALRLALLAALPLAFAACNTTDDDLFAPVFDVPEKSLHTPALLGGAPLSETFASPDGMALGSDGAIYVSITQRATAGKHPAKIARIKTDDSLENFFVLPPNEKTGKAAPMGLVFGPDGHLYFADNQSANTPDAGASSLRRIVIENAAPLRAETVATGINAANGVARWQNHIYVAEPDLRVPGRNLSGVYRFALAELDPANPVHVTGLGDPHLVLTLETKTPGKRGANGIAFDSKGKLYVNNFGDAEVMRYTFNPDGSPATGELFSRPQGLLCVDGLHIDAEDNLWVADLAGNAILKINAATGVPVLIAKNDPNDGSNGALDTPSECIRRGAKIYVSNIDLANGPNAPDPVQTISVITLK
jgi:sugar lactone lactonase YvrE